MSARVISGLASTELVIAPTPSAHFAAGGISKLGPLAAAAGGARAMIITDAGMLATPVIDAVLTSLADAGVTSTVFSGVHANPTTDDLAAGADAIASAGAPADAVLVAVGGGSSIDAAKGIALAAVNPERGRDLDYKNRFAARGLPIVAVPPTPGPGAGTKALAGGPHPPTHREIFP